MLMTPELTVLALATILQVFQLALYAVLANLQVGVKYSIGPRDEPRTLSGTAARVQRSLNNHFESLILYGAAATVITLSDQSTAYTVTWAWVYLAARTFYIPAYAFGLTPWRTVCWAISLTAILALLGASLL